MLCVYEMTNKYYIAIAGSLDFFEQFPLPYSQLTPYHTSLTFTFHYPLSELPSSPLNPAASG